MRSPWKFIAQLTSRKSAADKGEGTSDLSPEEAAPPDVTAEEVTSPTATLIETILSSEASPPASDAPEPAVEKTIGESDDALPVNDALTERSTAKVAPEAAKQNSRATKGGQRTLTPNASPSKARKKRAPEPRSPVSKKQPAAKKAEPARVVAKPPLAVSELDRITGLDDNIRRLRAELAEKLKLQNDQLKGMLDRFNRD
jgi:uncharacterized small protein (DUF1192 family)